MSAATAILITLVVYQIALLAIGLIAERWNRDEADFLLGGRNLGPLVAAISASASSSSVWTLLGISGAAYAKGLSALWLFPACVGGFALNWFLIAPRLRRLSGETGALTLTDILAGPRGRPGREAVVRVAAAIVLAALVVYVASQFQGAGKLFSEVLTTDEGAPDLRWMIILGAAVVVAYTILGGFWAVSITDTLQGLMMALTAVALPLGAYDAVGGFGGLLDGIRSVEVDGYASLTADAGGFAAIGLIWGYLGIGLGYPGQPHVVNRFMALAHEHSVRAARRYAMIWAVVVYAGMLFAGLAGRILVEQLQDPEEVFFHLTSELFSPVVAGVMIAAVLSAIMSTADSQLLVAASAISHDLAPRARSALARSRVIVLLLSAVSIAIALFTPKEIYDNVLFAWAALGAAFGPLLVLTLLRGPLSARGAILTMSFGFVAAVATHMGFTLTDEEKWISRVLPYAVALIPFVAGVR